MRNMDFNFQNVVKALKPMQYQRHTLHHYHCLCLTEVIGNFTVAPSAHF